jgi:hypothetical protein
MPHEFGALRELVGVKSLQVSAGHSATPCRAE